MRVFHIALALGMLTLILLYATPSLALDTNILNIDGLRSFYIMMYIPELKLFKASYTVENTTIYIANDNLLASRVLPIIGLYDLGKEVLTRLNNDYHGGYNGRIEVLFGMDIPDTFYTTYKEFLGDYQVNGTDYQVYWEKTNTSSILEDWYEYTDLLVYHALDKLLAGSRSEAELSFINLTKMWDGYGFRDKAFNGVYAVYKCSLFIYLYKALDYAGSTIIHDYDGIYYKCLDIVRNAQDPVYGGIHTDYIVRNGDIVITGDMNIETTSITVLALCSDYPEIIGSHVSKPTPSTLDLSIDASRLMLVLFVLFVFAMFTKFILRVIR